MLEVAHIIRTHHMPQKDREELDQKLLASKPVSEFIHIVATREEQFGTIGSKIKAKQGREKSKAFFKNLIWIQDQM